MDSKPNSRFVLTFDDGPDLYGTPYILDLLAQHRVHATSFVVGQRVVRYPEIVQRIVREGHTLGLHSWTHRSLISAQEYAAETSALVSELRLLRCPAPWHRLPHGWQGPHDQRPERLQMDSVGWTDETLDWDPRRLPEEIMTITKQAFAQSPTVVGAEETRVLLLHDGIGEGIAGCPWGGLWALADLLPTCAAQVGALETLALGGADLPHGYLGRRPA